jgi:uncharacterized protein
MALDGMATPLGMKPGKRQRGDSPLWRRGLLGFLILSTAATLAFGAWRFLNRDGGQGVVAVIERVEAPARKEAAAPMDQNMPTRPGQTTRSDVATVESESGVKVLRQNGGQAPGGLVIKVPDFGVKGSAAGADPRVSEQSQVGILPRIGEGGLMPRDVYAGAFNATSKPKIAIIMTGVGIGVRGTTDAITKLPGEVTLAFAPYGRDLPNQVARARRDGHEILLQVPMEPRDYPESDPGPHTLKADADPRANIERLHWLMSRFSGYVGLMNFMGGKLMGAEKSYVSLLEEVNRRGLLFLDDGTNRDSSTLRLSTKIGLPVRVSDQSHDTGGGKSLEVQLAEIEGIAKARGSAIISIPALSGNVDRLVAWQRDLAARGVVLAPLSAIMSK